MADTETPAAAAPAAPEAPATSPSADTETWLAEFDRTVPKSQPEQQPDEQPAPAVRQSEAAPATGDGGQIERLQQWAEGIELDRLQAQENADAAQVFGKAKAAVAEFPVPHDYAESYVRNRYFMDPVVKAAWDARYTSEDAMFRAEQTIERVIRDLVKSAKSIPNRQATEDRDAVTAAVRGASTKPPPSVPPNYGSLSDREFREVVKREHGYDPGV